MQFQLSDWFTVSRLPAIIPTFEIIFDYMEINAANAKLFFCEAKFRRQKSR